MIDTVAERGWLISTLRITQIFQMIVQAQWIDESAIATLPHVRKEDLHLFSPFSMALPKLCFITRDNYDKLKKILRKDDENEIREVMEFIERVRLLYIYSMKYIVIKYICTKNNAFFFLDTSSN